MARQTAGVESILFSTIDAVVLLFLRLANQTQTKKEIKIKK